MNYPDINPTVQAYSVQVLLDLLAHGCDRDTVKSKSHFDYFEKYFQTLAAKTVVVEDAYVDHDYLDDFAAFYVRCFSKYERFTRETLIKATLPGFFVREAATPKFASS